MFKNAFKEARKYLIEQLSKEQDKKDMPEEGSLFLIAREKDPLPTIADIQKIITLSIGEMKNWFNSLNS